MCVYLDPVKYLVNHYVNITEVIAVFNNFATRSRTNDSEGDYQ